MERMEAFPEKQVPNHDEQVYTMILFVISDGPNSKRAQENLKRLCGQWLPGRHRIQVVDVVKDFQSALDYNVLLTPSVVITDPPPRLMIHGDLSNPQRFIEALNLDEKRNDAD